jgi:exodeoxyribonuclease-5
MDKSLITTEIEQQIGYEATASQQVAIEQFAEYFCDTANYCVFLLTGYAGTGKTTIISSVIKVLKIMGINTILLAPTGRAAKVLANYSGHKATTIHKCIYRKQSTNSLEGNFRLNFNAYKDTVFIVDEASMLGNNDRSNSTFGSGRLLDDLLNFVFSGSNCRLILIGDDAQLPPIGTPLSPALNLKYLQTLDMRVYAENLTDVVRQSLDSGILFNATLIRNIITSTTEYELPKLQLSQFVDIQYITGENIIEEIESCYSKFGIDEVKIVCKTNKGTNIYNQGIRNRILWREKEISSGDLLLVVKNNYSWLPENCDIDFIANGDSIEIIKIYRKQELYGHRYADVLVRFVDLPEFEIEVKILIDTLTSSAPAMDANYYKELYNQLYAEYSYLNEKKKITDAIFSDPFFNALQVKFAYAVTCHKAQGGQWRCVFLDHEWLMLDNFTNDIKYEFLRWLYTAITRASEKLYLVNFNKIFLGV